MNMKKTLKKKLAKFAEILGILNNTLKPTFIQKFSRIKVYNALALPILLYGSEIWNLKQKDKQNLNSDEMQYFRRIVWDTHFLITKEMKKFWKSWKYNQPTRN